VSDLPQSMAAAVYQSPGRVVVEQRPVPLPAQGQVLVEVGHCGVCGSDLHLLVEGWATAGTVAGHEFTGVVRALGPGAEGWAEGDVVVGGPPARCGQCRRCLEAKPSQCERRGDVTEQLGGGFARFVLVEARALVRVPEGLSPRTAALAEPLAVALHAVTQAGLVAGDEVMVFGAGPIGALAIAALAATKEHRVTAVEPNEQRRQLALDVGAEAALSPDELARFERWEPERLAPVAVDAVLECSGHKAAMELGLHQLRRGGRLVLVGAGIHEPSFDPNRILLNELEIRGSFVYDADGFERALALLASGALPVQRLVERDDVGLEGLGPVLGDLAAGRVAGKVMVAPGTGDGRR